jgi:hypothetical protein
MLHRKEASSEKRDLCRGFKGEKWGGVTKAYSSVGMVSEEVLWGGAVEDAFTFRAFLSFSDDGFVAFSTLKDVMESTRPSSVITTPVVPSSRSMPPVVLVLSMVILGTLAVALDTDATLREALR